MINSQQTQIRRKKLSAVAIRRYIIVALCAWLLTFQKIAHTNRTAKGEIVQGIETRTYHVMTSTPGTYIEAGDRLERG